MDRAENKPFITQSDVVAFLRLRQKKHPHIKIVEQVLNGKLGWEVDASKEVIELLREYENNPLVPVKDFVDIAKRMRIQIRVWQSLAGKHSNGAAR
jgi:hypothetical protein